MNGSIFAEYQRQLVFASLDDFSPADALSGLYRGPYGDHAEKWRRAVVEFLLANVGCGLLEPQLSTGYVEGLEELLLCEEDQVLNWNSIYFTGTDKLSFLLSECGLSGWECVGSELSEELIAALKILYSKNGFFIFGI